MNLQPEELEKNGYVLLDSLGHKDLTPFIRTYLGKRTRYSVLYYLSNLLIFGYVVYLFVRGYNAPDYDLGDRFNHFSYGLGIAFLLLPLHEYIHVIAYRSQGAVNTSYAANLKKLYFMALADRFVANRKEFAVVALAPFMVISAILVAVLCFSASGWLLTVAGTLFTHTAMCSGDFGLLSYFEWHKNKQVVTFDDVEKGISYFYGKEAG